MLYLVIQDGRVIIATIHPAEAISTANGFADDHTPVTVYQLDGALIHTAAVAPSPAAPDHPNPGG